MKNEETLATMIEALNEKIDVLINEQINIKEQLNKNNKIIMQRMNKLQEYNEINDMRVVLLNDEINKTLKILGK